MNDHTKIEAANRDKVETLTKIIQSSHKDVAEKFNLTIENCSKHPSNCSEEWIINDFDRKVMYYILYSHDKPEGCIALEHASPDVCYIERLSVLPENRRNGSGLKLMKYGIETAAGLGVKEISIGIIAEFTELKEWYKKIGFIEGDTKKFDHLPFSVLLMSYKL